MSDHSAMLNEELFRRVAELRGRIAADAAKGDGIDAFRRALLATHKFDPLPGPALRRQSNEEIWDTAVRHLEEQVGLDALAAIYTSVTSEQAPNTPHELDMAALDDEERQDADAEIVRLSRLSPLEYERQRQAYAGRLGMRVSVLDAAVKATPRALSDRDPGGLGRPLDLPIVVPWAEIVDGVALLDSMATAIGRYVTLSAPATWAVALWAAGTHLFQRFEIFPRLTLRSATPRCGKTTLRNVVAGLVAKPLSADHIMAAALFRTIELERPTLLLDEADAYLPNNEDLRCIINSGHSREGQVIRCVGDNHEPRRFSTWAPILLAQIGNPPATIHDRSIVINLARKKQSEQVERFRGEQRDRLRVFARKAARWANDNADAIARKTPPVLDELNDRANDNWQPLLAIADTAGGPWPQRARDAARALAESDGHDASSIGEMLLSDIRSILEANVDPADADRCDRITSVWLAEQLAKKDGRPWPEWRAGVPITQNALARLLKTFEIHPRTIRLEGGQSLKGYMRSDFADAFARYGTTATVTPSQPSKYGRFWAAATVTAPPCVTVGKSQKASSDGHCDG